MPYKEKELKRYWTTKEVAYELGVSANTVNNYANRFNLPIKTIGIRVRRYTSKDISKLRRLITWLNQAK